jgi:hypothetical protein
VKEAQVEWKDGAPIRIQRAEPSDGFVLCPECHGWAWMKHFNGEVPCEAPPPGAQVRKGVHQEEEEDPMSHRYYVVVGLDVPGHFAAGATPEKEEWSAAHLVQSLLSDAIAERELHATVTGAIDLSPHVVDLIILAVREGTEKREASWQLQKEILDKKLAELRIAVDRLVAQRKDTP